MVAKWTDTNLTESMRFLPDNELSDEEWIALVAGIAAQGLTYEVDFECLYGKDWEITGLLFHNVGAAFLALHVFIHAAVAGMEEFIAEITEKEVARHKAELVERSVATK